MESMLYHLPSKMARDELVLYCGDWQKMSLKKKDRHLCWDRTGKGRMSIVIREDATTTIVASRKVEEGGIVVVHPTMVIEKTIIEGNNETVAGGVAATRLLWACCYE
jgi:hypothetical protein